MSLTHTHALKIAGAGGLTLPSRTQTDSDFSPATDRYTSGTQHVGNTSTPIDVGNVSVPGGWAMFENLGNIPVNISPNGNVAFLTLEPGEIIGPMRISTLVLYAAAPAGAWGSELFVFLSDAA